MKTHELKTWQPEYGMIVRGHMRADPRLNDKGFQVGDKVVFKEYDPENKKFSGKQVSTILTHANIINPLEWYTQEQIKQCGLVLIGLSRANDPVLTKQKNLVKLKIQPSQLNSLSTRRVDLRLNDRPELKLMSAILYQGYNDKKYTGEEYTRQVERLNKYDPLDFYKPEDIKKHGIAILGWKKIE